jgi:5'-methylthioadenosine phosphorylase
MLGIIGGTGLGDALFGEAFAREHVIATPFGAPSSPVRIVSFEGVEVAVLSRHGDGHLLSPSMVPYRANLFALKSVGVTHLLVSGAVGSLREEVRPRDLVLVDQVIDRTYRRVPTFFDEGMAVHVELAHPYCPALRERLATAGGTGVHGRGTYVCIEGPAFSTVAEAMMHRAWGADVVGMTAMPEARLAREAEMCCALVAFATDYDCWRPSEGSGDKKALLADIIGHLSAATANAVALLRRTIEDLARRPPGDKDCTCRSALELGIWSHRDRISASVVDRYGPLVSRYLGASST